MAGGNQDEPIRIRAKFHFDGGVEKIFNIALHPKTLELIVPEIPSLPDWTFLEYQKCVNCPLPGTVARCPIAVNISRLIEEFKNYTSYDKTWIVIETAERIYSKETSIQNGLSSLLGIYMVTSGCPIMDNLRPMVRFHLPFATTMETTYRSVSMYLIAQYFRSRRGLSADWKLEKLDDLYKKIAKVNKGLWGRLSKASTFDANTNAIVMLNTFGDALRFSMKKEFEEFIPYFEVYLRDDPFEKSPFF
ncbi:MAG: hypothetical protein WAV76_05480 [Bacteroidota bacterium]